MDGGLSVDRGWDWAAQVTESLYSFGLKELVFDLDVIIYPVNKVG